MLIGGQVAESGTCKLTDGHNNTCVTMETGKCANFIDVSHKGGWSLTVKISPKARSPKVTP